MFELFKDKMRLVSENKDLRNKVASLETLTLRLEAERERLIRENRERDLLWSDRFLTAKVETHAIADQAKSYMSDPVRDTKANEALQRHLDSEEERLINDALDAGLSPDQAKADFSRLKPRITEDFLARI